MTLTGNNCEICGSDHLGKSKVRPYDLPLLALFLIPLRCNDCLTRTWRWRFAYSPPLPDAWDHRPVRTVMCVGRNPHALDSLQSVIYGNFPGTAVVRGSDYVDVARELLRQPLDIMIIGPAVPGADKIRIAEVVAKRSQDTVLIETYAAEEPVLEGVSHIHAAATASSVAHCVRNAFATVFQRAARKRFNATSDQDLRSA